MPSGKLGAISGSVFTQRLHYGVRRSIDEAVPIGE